MAGMSNTIWGTRFNSATLSQVADYLGTAHVAAILDRADAVGYCKTRATGWWDANDGEAFSAYTRLAQIIIEGGHPLSWECKCATCTQGRRTLGRAMAL